MNLLDKINKEQLRTDLPSFRAGDTVRVHVRISEKKNSKGKNKKEVVETTSRIQVFEGIVIAKKNGGISETFTVRKLSAGFGVERVFPLHSPVIEKIEVIKNGRVRRAKLNYIRNIPNPKIPERRKFTDKKSEQGK